MGAGQHAVRRSTRVFESLDARRHHRARRTLYHAALEVQLDAERWTVEMAPAWGTGPPRNHGVTATGPVGFAASVPRGCSATRYGCGETGPCRTSDLRSAIPCTSPPTVPASVG